MALQTPPTPSQVQEFNSIWRTWLDSLRTQVLGIVAGSYLFLNFRSTGIDDNATSTAITIDSSEVITLTNDLGITEGGTGESTAQAAIDTLTQVSGAGDEHVLTKDTISGNAEWKIASIAIPDGSIDEAKLSFTVQFTEAFTSSEQTITSAGLLTIAHGLSAIPSLIQARLICKTAELNYSIGDELIIYLDSNSTSATDNRGGSLVVNATNLNIRFGSNASTFNVLNKNTGGQVPITNANWKLVMRAWA